MGDADLLDRFISQYRPNIQGKKRYWPLFLNGISIATVAAWRIHVNVKTERKLGLLDFLQSVVANLLKKSKVTNPGSPGKRIQNKSDDLHHVVKPEKHGHCVFCKKNTIKKCL